MFMWLKNLNNHTVYNCRSVWLFSCRLCDCSDSSCVVQINCSDFSQCVWLFSSRLCDCSVVDCVIVLTKKRRGWVDTSHHRSARPAFQRIHSVCVTILLKTYVSAICEWKFLEFCITADTTFGGKSFGHIILVRFYVFVLVLCKSVSEISLRSCRKMHR